MDSVFKGGFLSEIMTLSAPHRSVLTTEFGDTKCAKKGVLNAPKSLVLTNIVTTCRVRCKDSLVLVNKVMTSKPDSVGRLYQAKTNKESMSH